MLMRGGSQGLSSTNEQAHVDSGFPPLVSFHLVVFIAQLVDGGNNRGGAGSENLLKRAVLCGGNKLVNGNFPFLNLIALSSSTTKMTGFIFASARRELVSV